jgi:hypothetical protein
VVVAEAVRQQEVVKLLFKVVHMARQAEVAVVAETVTVISMLVVMAD